MKKINKEVMSNILIIFAFIFNIVIFAPLEIFYTNKNEFWFGEWDLVPIIIGIAIILFVILILPATLLKDKKRDGFIKIIFVLTLGLYIQGNFLNFGYNVLDGSAVEWNTMVGKGVINTAIWILIISLPYFFSTLKKEKQFKIFSLICSIFIVLIEIITLLAIIIGMPKSESDDIQLVNKEIFNLSKNNNIVVFMSDTFEGTYMNKILDEHEEYKEKLKDFTCFDNCTGVSFYTYSSMPTLLTGIPCKVGNTLKENVEYCFDNSILYKELKANNYNIDIYTEKMLKNNNAYINNLEKVKSTTSLKAKTKISNKMYKYALYRYLPHFLKPNFIVNSDEFYAIRKEDGALPYFKKTYFLDDVAFNTELKGNGITTDIKQNSFKFYQTNGMHQPYNTTENLEYDYSDEYANISEEERRYKEGLSSINLLCNYIDELKEKEIYENTTIIFMADHGYNNRFYTTLLVKKANDRHDFNISSAPVTLAQDLIPTILNIATDSKKYGRDFFDYEEDEIRTRQIYDYTYETNLLKAGNNYKVISKMIFETQGLAKDKDSFYLVDEEYENENKQLTEEYRFGDSIKLEKINDLKSANLIGFILDTVDLATPVGCNIGQNTYLKVNTSKTENNITAKIVMDKVYNNEQTINFKIDDEIIYTCKASNNNKEITFEIPKDMWNMNDELTIKMEFPDAKFGSYNSTIMPAITLNEIIFSN